MVCARNALTAPLVEGTIANENLTLLWSELAASGPRFLRLLESMNWDVAELPLVTSLIARSRGFPVTLLPVAVQARFQHPYFVVDEARGMRLESIRTVGVRSHTATTVVWIKSMLRERGIDPGTIRWIAMDGGDVPGHSEPPALERMPPGDLRQMLSERRLDAAVLPDIRGVCGVRGAFGDADACAREWHARRGFAQINHVLVANSAFAHERPSALTALLDLVRRAKAQLDASQADVADFFPVGWPAMEPCLALVEAEVRAEGLIA
ncbi:MAG TPA: hypothetical protein VHA82_16525 [Ramlibacter sp.]|nr:hypothetical protein [Ramlibacter sp.]